MTTKLLFILVAYVKMTNSQYYGQTPTSCQPYNYYPSASTSPVSPSTYATPSFAPPAYPTSMYTPPQMLPSPYPTAPTFPTSPSTIAPAPPPYAPSNFAPIPMFAPPFTPTPSYQQPTYAFPTLATLPIPYAPLPKPAPKYQQTTVSPKSTSTPTPKYSSPATAYYLTMPLEVPKAAVMKEQVKENLIDKLPSPTYPCPFCTGFANVPTNSKVPPPPPAASVLPGILDKIPTIRIPDELKIKKLGKLAKSTPLLSDLFEHKLSGKLRFDQDLLDGFLTGLGLGNCDD